MGVLADTMDMIRDVSELGGIDGRSRMKTTFASNSLSKMAKDGTMQFPVLITKSIDMETGLMVSKALERQYSEFVQIATSLHPIISSDELRGDSRNYLKKFHTNMGSATTMSVMIKDITDVADLVDESTIPDILEAEGYIVMSSGQFNGNIKNSIVKEHLQDLTLVCELYNTELLEPIGANSPDSYAVTEARNRRGRNNQNNNRNQNNNNNRPNNQNNNRNQNNNNNRPNNQNNNRANQQTGSIGGMQASLHQAQQFANISSSIANSIRDAQRHAEELNAITGNGHITVEMPKQIMKDNDAKKANELISTLLHIRVHVVGGSGTVSLGYQDIMVAIKTIVHPVTSEEIIDNFKRTRDNNAKFFNFIKWTSGEIKFFKDLLFHIDEIKTDTIEKSNGRSRWWLAFKRRKQLYNVFSRFLMNNSFLPNGTIVVSSEEVSILKEHHGMDLFNRETVEKLMKTYFLLSFVIVDDTSKVVHFWFDGEEDFETVSYSGLEKENGQDEKKFKEMLKMLNRNY